MLANRCRVCGCTEFAPCELLAEPTAEIGDTYPCCWMNTDHSLCSNPHCVAVVPTEELLQMLSDPCLVSSEGYMMGASYLGVSYY